ncbi:MAG TPA: dihydrolipoamide acetyltransferase family protein [Acidimicrobiales bacterium]|jgi:2-oxoisovalerate dehydrogenase E2 component (dihydrolipoyl transacylase)|nr:dihydrolipoamide acetyltransferase family protein [Acidimicrobiales bacterium]
MSDVRNFLLPDLGEGLTEAEVVAWHVAPGEIVELNQVLLEVETEKAVVELPSPFAGTVAELFVAAGATVDVGAPLISIETAGAPASPDPESAPASEKVSVLVGYGPSDPAPSRRRRGGGRSRHDRPEHPSAIPSPAMPSPPGSRPLAAPPVRFMARQQGIDLAEVAGNGPGGIVTREDLAAHLAARAAPAPRLSGRVTRSPVKGVQKHMAEAMVRSATTAPQACVFLTVDVTPTSELLGRLRANRRFEGVKLTMLTVAARAVVLALRDHPALNSAWDDATGEIVTKHYVNLGIAVAGPRGLVVPNVRDAHELGFRELATALEALTEQARAARSTPADLSGGTITITNVGVFGVDAGVPLLNPGEAAILALGAVQRRPWEYQDEVALRDVVTLSLAFDHRLVDGEGASRFLRAVGEILADPTNLIAFS